MGARQGEVRLGDRVQKDITITMAQKFYRTESGEKYYTLNKHVDDMREHELDELTLHEAEREIDGQYMWCSLHNGEIERKRYNHYADTGCGKDCEDYKPRNGRSGICHHLTHCSEETGRIFRLTIVNNKPKLEEITDA